jgi:hypothetical protein
VSPRSPAALPLEARQAAWSRLWQRLLAEPPPECETEDKPHDAEAELKDAG